MPETDKDISAGMIKKYINTKDIIITEGGSSRQESVYRGLSALESDPPDFVLIHDGARPWVTKDIIQRVIEGTVKHGGCIPVVSTADTLKEVDKSGIILKHLKRESVFGAQTPQGFNFREIIKAHRAVSEQGLNGMTDDAEVYNFICKTVFTVAGDIKNRKITYRSDIE